MPKKRKKQKGYSEPRRGRVNGRGQDQGKGKGRRSSLGKQEQKDKMYQEEKPKKYPILTLRLKKLISAIVLVFLGLVIALSFIGLAGTGGKFIFDKFYYGVGKTIFFTPIILFLGALLVLKPQKKRTLTPVICGLILLIFGISGILAVRGNAEAGGALGRTITSPVLEYFGLTVATIAFSVVCLIGLLIFWEFLPKRKKQSQKKFFAEAKQDKKDIIGEEKPEPKFQIKALELLQKKKESFKKPRLAVIARSAPAAVSTAVMKGQELPDGIDSDYNKPALSVFDTSEEKASGGDTDYNAEIIKKTLLNFGIHVEMAGVHVGPTVAQYTFKPAEGVKLSKITGLNNDLALALASHPIRIEAPIPGKSLVGIEVPNQIRAVVKMGNLVKLDEFQNGKSPLVLAIGKDVMGVSMLPSLGAMPHMMVAGATGSGKTVCLNSMITGLVYKNSPKLLRLILIDPKRVEFPVYSNLPHLLTPVIFNSQKAVNALNWLVGEMERRFDVLKDFGVRDIGTYNKTLQEKLKKRAEGFEIMPYIVLVIDELADLMMSKGKEVEASIVRISQLARAVGIHLILATQRPSVEVITGLIKANITARIAFQVASQIDSRTILDMSGAEKLLGKGDMLFLSSEFSKPKRIQGCFVSPNEIKKVVKFIEKENAPEEQEDISADAEVRPIGGAPTEIDIDDSNLEEPLYNEAKETVIQYGKASASMLQRRLKIGYARAARILDLLEQNGVVGPQDGAKPRAVYAVTKAEDDGFHDAGDIEMDTSE